MESRFRYLIPHPARRMMRRLYYLAVDTLDFVSGRQEVMVPPKRLRPDYVVSSGFREHGDHFARLLVELGQLQPSDHVLDLGCGIGRVAVPLTKILSPEGRYDGLDIVPESIAWCQKEISKRYPNFHFQVADVYNSQYNPGGMQRANEYDFPFEDQSFDLIFLKSVFTHMLPDDIENYTGEIARTLKRTGRALITFFLLNERSIQAMDEGKARRDFNYKFQYYRTESDQSLESAVAYDEAYIRLLMDRFGLQIEEPIHYGAWSGSGDAKFAQDIVVSHRS